MDAVRIIQGTAVPLDRSDVDTDQIIPAEWLKRVERTGFGAGLFSSWRESASRALAYMGLTAGTPMRDVAVYTVFIGSCTNSRIEDLRAAAAVLDGRHITAKRVMIVPGSHAVKAQAEAEGLHHIFRAAGADWREPGCSMCLAMNPDKLAPEERCASTSNRNFEGRQGFKGRTHLVSPAMAAAAAIAGHFVDVREWR